MKAQRRNEPDVAPVPVTRFGVRLGGVAVAMPAGTPLEFVADAAIYPLPLAPARVAGLMQLRGQPLVVLDASTPQAARGLRRHDVLVIGQPPRAAAVLVDEAPQPLLHEGRRSGCPPAPPCAFAGALGAGEAVVQQAGDVDRTGDADTGDAHAHECRYDLDPARLFDALVQG